MRSWFRPCPAGPRRGFRDTRRACLVLVLLIGTGWENSSAQGRGPPPRGLQVTARNDLRFGTVTPGVPARIAPDSPRGSGMFEIRGNRNMSVSVTLTLPVEMLSAAGDRLPLSFGAGDGLASTNRGRNRGVVFDPRNPLVATLGTNGRLFIRLGGTALPARLQIAAPYRATITLTVANLGS